MNCKISKYAKDSLGAMTRIRAWHRINCLIGAESQKCGQSCRAGSDEAILLEADP